MNFIKNIIRRWKAKRAVKAITRDYFSGVIINGGDSIESPTKDKTTMDNIGSDGIWRPPVDSVVELLDTLKKGRDNATRSEEA